jgi:hypothetical protein
VVDKENLQVHARLGICVYNKYQVYSQDCLDTAIAILSCLAAKADQLLNSLLEATDRKALPAASNAISQKSDTGRTEASTSVEVARPDQVKNLLFYNPRTVELVYDIYNCLVLALEDRYLQSQEYNNSALDDLIVHTERAVAFLSTGEQLGLGKTKHDIDNLGFVGNALSRALMARLFRYSRRAPVPVLGTSSAVGVLQLPPSCTPLSTTGMTTQCNNLGLSPVSGESIYEKTSLTPGTKHIRLLDLHPGVPDETVVCTLRITDLETRPEYEVSRLIQGLCTPVSLSNIFKAMSYVWGDPKVLTPITVNGTMVCITVNLSAALRRLRLPTKMRRLWADALCINQEDLSEKQHQVGLMRDIYASAKGVAIWLGDPWQTSKSPHVECAPEFLSDVSTFLKPDIVSALSPYFVPVTVLSAAYSPASGFRRTLEKLPEEFLPIREDAYADQWNPHTIPGSESTFLAGLGFVEKLNTGGVFEELFSFQRWAGFSQGQKLSEFSWENDRSIANILRSLLDARQWPVVGAFVILQGLASDIHFNELPFFEKNENISRCRRQSWAKSASALCRMLANLY